MKENLIKFLNHADAVCFSKSSKIKKKKLKFHIIITRKLIVVSVNLTIRLCGILSYSLNVRRKRKIEVKVERRGKKGEKSF
jgi:hypothetical protein